MKCALCPEPVSFTDSLPADRVTGKPSSAHAACLMLATINQARKTGRRTRAVTGRLGQWKEVRR